MTSVLTGKAATAQAFRRSLKQQAIPLARVVAKVYWVRGKTGVD